MSNVIPLGNVTRLDLDPDSVLESLKGQLEGLVYVGFDHDGEIFAGSTYADGGEVLWLIEHLKIELMNAGED